MERGCDPQCCNICVCVCVCVNRSVMSNSLQPHGLQPARLLCPWDSPGKNTGVGCHSLLQGILPTRVSCIAGRFFTVWATREALALYLRCFLTETFRICAFPREPQGVGGGGGRRWREFCTPPSPVGCQSTGLKVGLITLGHWVRQVLAHLGLLAHTHSGTPSKYIVSSAIRIAVATCPALSLLTKDPPGAYMGVFPITNAHFSKLEFRSAEAYKNINSHPEWNPHPCLWGLTDPSPPLPILSHRTSP